MKNFIYVLLLSILCLNIPAQERNYSKDFLKVGGDIFTAPAHFDKNDWINLGLTAGAVGASFFVEKDVQAFALRNQSKFNDALFYFDHSAVEISAAAIAATLIYGFAADKDNVKDAGVQLAEAFFYSEVANSVLKVAVGRSRPFLNEGHTEFRPVSFSDEHMSFGSGHTVMAFSIAKVLADRVENHYLRGGIYALAVLMGGARIYHNDHWLSDVVMGAAVGYFIGDFTVNHYTNKANTNLSPYSVKFSIPF